MGSKNFGIVEFWTSPSARETETIWEAKILEYLSFDDDPVLARRSLCFTPERSWKSLAFLHDRTLYCSTGTKS